MAVIEDVSDVVRSNRLAAWAEMARIIAHEIKNPLTPIRLSVEHLREVWRRQSPDFERVLEECVTNVLRQTEELRRSASEFGDYARLPRPEIRPTDVAMLLRDAAAAYSAAPGVRWVVEAPAGLQAMADPRLLSRVLSNLVGNSVDALEQGGRIRLAAARRDGRIEASVEDDGPGVPRRDPARASSTPTFRRRAAGPGSDWRSRRRSWRSTAARSARRTGRKAASASGSISPRPRGKPLREARVEARRGAPVRGGAAARWRPLAAREERRVVGRATGRSAEGRCRLVHGPGWRDRGRDGGAPRSSLGARRCSCRPGP